ncbi:MAG: hypothetical protein V1736_01700 [Pseudomonadota bacterium]
MCRNIVRSSLLKANGSIRKTGVSGWKPAIDFQIKLLGALGSVTE